MKKTPAELDELFKRVLDLNREIVGIKFLHDEAQYNEANALDIKGKIRYCVLVKSASLGHALKIRGENCSCQGASRTLGFIKPNKRYSSGLTYMDFQFYESMSISYKTVQEIESIQHCPIGIMAKPLYMYKESTPDVVIVVTKAYNAMRISQGYTYKFGLKKNFTFAGNQALCFESTTIPYKNSDMNISMLCAGTRHYASWNDEELCLGIYYNKFQDILDGVINTINTIEPNDKKNRIINKNGSDLVDGYRVTLNSAYYLGNKTESIYEK
ncbi:DUF169 domain-containing protein [Hathewaya massiliensis]|uniref:DUF169 domain-containing protein n=1 Tax=Hathewaya massiliensis TaxID=1964382 RepID=UPI0011583C56|nr:DUF169 domain-containing protein [Hathewaya massiliensis]